MIWSEGEQAVLWDDGVVNGLRTAKYLKQHRTFQAWIHLP